MTKASSIFYNFIHKHAFFTGVFAVIFGFVFFSFSLVVANGETVGPSDSHVVSLYVDGQESSISTRASNVDEFIKKANIQVGSNDLVEPSRDTRIV